LVDCGDERLQALVVSAVEPAPDASRLLVTVGSSVPTPDVDRQAVLAALAAANGRLRAGVAEAVTRKRAPQLVFHFAAPFSAGQAAEEGRT
jgi:ribosome-binding factor A